MLPLAVFSVQRSVSNESAGFVPRLRKSSQTLTGKVMYGSVISKPSLAVRCKCKPTSAIFSSQFVRKVNSLSTRVTGDIKTSCDAI